MTKPTITIETAVIDESPVVRAGIQHLLLDDETIDLVISVATPREAIREMITYGRPDVILMDWKRDRGGLRMTRQLLKYDPEIKLVLLSTEVSNHYTPSRALKSGVRGWIPKGASAERLKQAIYTVSWGQRYLCMGLMNTMGGDQHHREVRAAA